MPSYKRWQDVRAAHVERASGEAAVEAGKQELLAMVREHRFDEAAAVANRPGPSSHPC